MYAMSGKYTINLIERISRCLLALTLPASDTSTITHGIARVIFHHPQFSPPSCNHIPTLVQRGIHSGIKFYPHAHKLFAHISLHLLWTLLHLLQNSYSSFETCPVFYMVIYLSSLDAMATFSSTGRKIVAIGL
jgi:hypothetical protein